MSEARSTARRLADAAGLACLVATFLLASPGVRVVRADGQEPMMSVDPALVDPEPPAAPAPAAPVPAPKPASDDPKALERAGVPSIEVAPGIVVLNTRGYNYGPPPTEIDPAAAALESKTPAE